MDSLLVTVWSRVRLTSGKVRVYVEYKPSLVLDVQEEAKQ